MRSVFCQNCLSKLFVKTSFHESLGITQRKRVSEATTHFFALFGETRECLHNWFRTGSAFSANGSVDFMMECFAKLPKRVWKVFIRADSAFFDGDDPWGIFFALYVRLQFL
jgi:hypothetical protein